MKLLVEQARRGVERPAVLPTLGRAPTGPSADRVLRGKKMGREREALQRHRQSCQIQLFTLELKIPAIDQAQFR